MSTTTAASTPSKTWHGPPPPPELINNSSSLQLLSQGAEARIWLVTLANISKGGEIDGGVSHKKSVHVGSGINVPQLLSFTQHPSPLSTQTPTTDTSPPQPLKFICKERFPKKYRHPQLDVSLTKSRTKGEARSLVRCRRADVACPNVLAIGHWPNKSENDQEVQTSGNSGGDSNGVSTTSSCLFLECVEGCTVREYFEQRSAKPTDNDKLDDEADAEGEPTAKRPKCEESDNLQQEERVTTVIDSQTLRVAHTIGTLVAKMHAAGVIHGDLTTSNIMVSNPPWLCNNGVKSNDKSDWTPQLVLIDFGLAASTATANNKNSNSSGGKKAKPHKQQHNAEEKAVDLYVLERAFLSTHPESEPLVEEVWKGYRSYFEGLDRDCQKDDTVPEDGNKSDEAVSSCTSRSAAEGMYTHIATTVLNRLEQVRMRGRKRECFG